MVAEPRLAHSLYYQLPPLTRPSVDAAIEFIHEIIPTSIFGGSNGRRRRQPGNLGANDQGFLVFYRQDHPDDIPQQVPLRSPDSLLRYLEGQLVADLAEHWVCLQSTQYGSCMRDGKRIRGASFSAAHTRHIPAMVVDMDPGLMSAEVRRLIQEDWEKFIAVVSGLLEQIGVTWFRIVRSSLGGAHVYLRLAKPDGRPLGANEKTRAVWDRTAKALCRYFSAFGADPNAVKVTQPFVIPGLPRMKHNGYVPYVAASRDGEYTDLYALLRELARRKLVYREAIAEPLEVPQGTPADEFLADVRQHACGLRDGRKRAIYGIAVAGLAKGGTEQAVWEVMTEYNGRCTPPLSEKQLRKAFRSAQRCQTRHSQLWRTFSVVPWNRLRGELGMPTKQFIGFTRDGRRRPITPPKPRELRVREHYEEVAERLLRFVAGEGGGRLRMTQADIAAWIGTNPNTLRAVLKKLAGEGRLEVVTKRGAGGLTELSSPTAQQAEATSAGDSVNEQSRIAPVGGGVGCVGGSVACTEGSAVELELPAPTEKVHQVGESSSSSLLVAGGALVPGASVERAQRELWAGTIGAVSLLWLLERVEPGQLEGCLRAARARATHARSSAHRVAIMVGLERWRRLGFAGGVGRERHGEAPGARMPVKEIAAGMSRPSIPVADHDTRLAVRGS